MTRVLILQEYIPQYRVPLFEALRQRLQESGVELVVAAGQPAGVLAKRGDSAALAWSVPLRQREIRLFGRRLTFRRMRELVRDADLVVMEQARRNLDLYSILLRAHRPRVALWGHGVDRTRGVSAFERRLSRWLLHRADWFFAYTEGAKAAVTGLRFPDDAVTVLQNAIDTSGLRMAVNAVDTDERAELTERLDLRGKTALYLGALDSYKRVPMLLDMAVVAHEREPDFRLIIAGDGADRDLVIRAAAAHPCIRYVGAAFGADKAALLASADVLVSPGSVGLGVLDSFAARTPMVVTMWPWHGPEHEYLQHDRNAVITDDSVPALVDGMLSLLDDPGRLGRLAVNCAVDAETYTVEEMARRFAAGMARVLKVDRT